MLFKIQKIGTVLIALLFFAMSISCAKLTPTDPSSPRTTIAARISFAQSGLTAASFDSLIMTVSGNGINPIKQQLILDGVKARAQIDVPAKVGLLATVTAYRDSRLVMSGADSFQVADGQTLPLTIKMNFLVPTLILSPPDTSMSVGGMVTLYLGARGVLNMATFGAQVQFDPDVLSVTELGREDAFLKSNSGNVNQLLFTKNNTLGTVDVVLGIFPSTAAVSGQGNVGRIVFTAVDTGVTDLMIRVDHDSNSNYALFDQNADLMYAMGLGGRITVQ